MIEVRDVFNLSEAFLDRHLTAGRGSRPALRSRGRTITYAELAAETNRAGNALRSLGVDLEQRVAILLPDSPELVATFLGAIRIGAVALPLSTLLRPADYRYMLADSRPAALVVDAALWPQLEPLRAELPHLRHIVVVGDAPSATHSYAELTRTASPVLDPEPTSKDDMCFWQYSSGTTGFPKAAVHLQHDLACVVNAYGRHVIGIGEGDRVFSIAKLYFSYGLGNSLALPLAAGACAVLVPERPTPELAFETIARERPTLFFAVPTFYAALLATPGSPDLGSLRLCVSAGEALPKALCERWVARFGVEVLDGIGSTEAGYIFVSNVPGRVRAGTSGEVVPGYAVRLTGADGAPVRDGEPGDLWVSGDSTFAYYWNKHESTTATIVGEWMATGDRYRRRDGAYVYEGRSDDMLKVGGIWVSPIEIESVLLEDPAVLECAVVGRADADDLIKPAAYVVLRGERDGDDALARELQAFVKDRLAPYKYPRWIEFVRELPKTPTGKIQRYKLRGEAR